MSAADREAAQAIATAREAAFATQRLNSQSFAEAAVSAVQGSADAQIVLDLIRGGLSAPDALFNAAVEVANRRDPERTAAWFRALQKALERV